jgi:hypothetical protein
MGERIWSLPPVVEKTTAWKESDLVKAEPPKEAKIELVDHDYERAKKRTELLKTRMSEPEWLRLPPLLEERRKKYGIPDGVFKVEATWDRIIVFPIDLFDGEQAQKTTGGIWKPATTQLRDQQEGHRGILISAGLTAMDRLASHGYELGHIVHTNKNVPFARRCEQFEAFEVYYLAMREADLLGSEDLREQLRTGEAKIVDVGGDDGYNHQIARRQPDGTYSARKKTSAYVQDTW